MATGFVVDSMYYQFFFAGSPIRHPVISTWAFLGYLHTPGVSSVSCDQAEHFYVFKEWNGWSSERDIELGGVGIVLKFPSLEQARESMLSWEEFQAKFEDLRQGPS